MALDDLIDFLTIDPTQPLAASFRNNGKRVDLQQFLNDQYAAGMIVLKNNRVAFEEYRCLQPVCQHGYPGARHGSA